MATDNTEENGMVRLRPERKRDTPRKEWWKKTEKKPGGGTVRSVV